MFPYSLAKPAFLVKQNPGDSLYLQNNSMKQNVLNLVAKSRDILDKRGPK